MNNTFDLNQNDCVDNYENYPKVKRALQKQFLKAELLFSGHIQLGTLLRQLSDQLGNAFLHEEVIPRFPLRLV